MIRRLLLTGALLCASLAVSAPVTAQPNRPEADAPLSPEVMEDVLEAAERSGQYNAVVMTAEHAYATLPADGDRFGAAQRMLVLYKYDANAKMREASEMARRNRVVDRIYGEGARAAPAARRFELDYYYATYLNASHQVGRSMPIFRSVLADANSASDPSIRFRAFVQYASNHLDMGQPVQAGVILGRARDYIATLPAPAMHQARLQMMTMEMSQRLAVGDEDGVRALWREEAAVLAGADIDDATRVRAGLAAIHYLNRVGDGAGAQAAQQVVARARPRSGQARREIDYALACMPIVDPGDPTAFAADPAYEEKFDGCDELNSVAALQGQMRYAPGYVFELQGKDQRAAALYQTAVDAAERARDSFPVEQRGEFFAGRWQPAYGGLLRVSARAAERRAGGDLVNFYDALIASERARARQFGDQQGETADFGTTIEWARFMDQMAPGHVIVVIASQERHLVVLGFNKTRQRAVVKPLGATMLNARAEWLHRMLKDRSSDPAVLARELDAFSRDTLGEVRGLLAGAQRVTIIADGAMTRIPFGLFTAADGGPPLIAGAEVSSALSLRSLRAAPASSSGAGLLGVGDPVFPLPPAPVDYPQDRLLEQARGSRTFGVRDGLLFLEPLPFSRREAVDVAAAFEPAARAALANADVLQRPGLRVLLGGRADETTVKESIGGYRYLHFATHGLLAGDLGLPEPAIALAASGEDDGYLMASEVERLRLNADLAVLSACNTGAGRIVAGEGVIGIARAFLRAGARATMVSLWPVDDEGASVLMADFYRRLRAGGTPAAALRESALAMRAQAPYAHPYYWAPFILIAR